MSFFRDWINASWPTNTRKNSVQPQILKTQPKENSGMQTTWKTIFKRGLLVACSWPISWHHLWIKKKFSLTVKDGLKFVLIKFDYWFDFRGQKEEKTHDELYFYLTY